MWTFKLTVQIILFYIVKFYSEGSKPKNPFYLFCVRWDDLRRYFVALLYTSQVNSRNFFIIIYRLNPSPDLKFHRDSIILEWE